MSTPAGVLLLVVALIAMVGVVGTFWALRALPKPRRRRSRSSGSQRRRRSTDADAEPASSRRSRPLADAVAVAAAAAVPVARPPAVERSVQSDHERIEAMRALLHRGDERARRQAAESDQPAFADTQAFDDDEPPLPLNWSTPNKPPKPPGGDSGHIPL